MREECLSALDLLRIRYEKEPKLLDVVDRFSKVYQSIAASNSKTCCLPRKTGLQQSITCNLIITLYVNRISKIQYFILVNLQ